jgi:hypothetical protein
MRYIKPFNESINPDEFEELKDFCETSLINLIDRDTTNDDCIIEYTVIGGIRINPSIINNSINIVLFGPLSDDNGLGDTGYERLSNWCWNDVKDSYIPFIQLLKRRYKLATNYIDFKFRTTRSRYEMSDKSFRIEDVINDRIDLDKSNLFSISVKIIGKI